MTQHAGAPPLPIAFDGERVGVRGSLRNGARVRVNLVWVRASAGMTEWWSIDLGFEILLCSGLGN